MLTWHVVNPELLAERVDFSIALNTGRPQDEPIERIEIRLAGLVNQAALEYLAEKDVRTLLDAGIEPLRLRIEAALNAATSLTEIGIAVVVVRLTNLAPSSELERALQTPTFEALQQKADEAKMTPSPKPPFEPVGSQMPPTMRRRLRASARRGSLLWITGTNRS